MGSINQITKSIQSRIFFSCQNCVMFISKIIQQRLTILTSNKKTMKLEDQLTKKQWSTFHLRHMKGLPDQISSETIILILPDLNYYFINMEKEDPETSITKIHPDSHQKVIQLSQLPEQMQGKVRDEVTNFENIKGDLKKIQSRHKAFSPLFKKFPIIQLYLRQQIPLFFAENNEGNFSQNTEKSLDQIFNTLLKQGQKIPEHYFSVVSKQTYFHIQKQLDKWLSVFHKNKQEVPSLINLLFPLIRSSLSTSNNFQEFLRHDIFTNASESDSPLYLMRQKLLVIFFLQRVTEYGSNFINSYAKVPGRSLPFIYKLSKDKSIWPLKYYSDLLDNSLPYLVSVGAKKMGKSNLLNLIFKTDFESHCENVGHEGADIVFSSQNYQLGLNVIDFQGDVAQNMTQLKAILKTLGSKVYLLFHFDNQNADTSGQLLKKIMENKLVEQKKMIIVVRDVQETNIEDTKQMFKLLNNLDELSEEADQIQVQCIQKIEPKSKIFRKHLSALQKTIIEHILPPTFENKDEIYENNYLKIQGEISKIEEIKGLSIISYEKQIHDFLLLTLKKLNGIKSCENFNKLLFPFIELSYRIDEHETNYLKEKNTSKLNFGDYYEETDNLEKQYNELVPHQLVIMYHDIICESNLAKKEQFERIISKWFNPIISPYIKKKGLITSEINDLDGIIDTYQATKKWIDISQRQTNDENIKKQILKKRKTLLTPQQLRQRQKQIQQKKSQILTLEREINEKSFDREHMMRQIIYLLEKKTFLETKVMEHRRQIAFGWLKPQQFYNGMYEYVRKGGQFELVDGNNKKMRTNVLIQILKRFDKKQSTHNRFFSTAILGPKSSGKSTLLNFLYNTCFQVSAGRCTHGLYASFLPTSYQNAEKCLILDSEGLLSIQRGDSDFDIQMTILAMSIAEVVIMNINGYINTAMKKILKISLYAANKLQFTSHKRPIIYFVLRNMADDDKERQGHIIRNLEEEFNEIAKVAKVDVKDIIDFRNQDSFELMFSAFNKDYSQFGDKKLLVCVVNNKFRSGSQKLRDLMFKQAQKGETRAYSSFQQFVDHTSYIWTSILNHSNLLQYESIKGVQDKQKLASYLTQLFEKQIIAKGKLKQQLDQIVSKGKSEGKNIKDMIDDACIICEENVLVKFEIKLKQSGGQKYKELFTEEIKTRIRFYKEDALQKLKEVQIKIKNELKQRLELHNVNMNHFNFTLKWDDPNDLDLHVICPCGTHIFYRNKKCVHCDGLLDKDARNELNPLQHIFFKTPKEGKYIYWINFYGQGSANGISGSSTTKYKFWIHENQGQSGEKIWKQQTNTLSNKATTQKCTYRYERGLKFNKHIQKNFDTREILVRNQTYSQEDKAYSRDAERALKKIQKHLLVIKESQMTDSDANRQKCLKDKQCQIY